MITLLTVNLFMGLVVFQKKNKISEIKTGKLLNDLSLYLRGFNKSLQGIDSTVIIVLDNDDRETDSFRNQLEQVTKNNNITIDHVFCIAVEEVEAWLLGDKEAVLKAYPKAKTQLLNSYIQDSIIGTWERLAEIVYPGGLKKLQKESNSYSYIGAKKCEWAENIGSYMNIEKNVSPSFKYFIKQLKDRSCLLC